MTLQQLCGRFLAIFAITEALFLALFVGTSILHDQLQYIDSTRGDFDRIFRANRTELVANLTLKHRRLIEEHLRGLAAREDLLISLWDGDQFYGQASASGKLVQKSFSLDHGGRHYGSISFGRAVRPYAAVIDKTIICIVGAQIGIFFAALALVRRWAAESLIQPISALLAQAVRGGTPADSVAFRYVPAEVADLSSALAQLWKNYRETSRIAAVGEVSVQLAHDIRSPLAALEVISVQAAQLPEDLRILLRCAVARVRDIANHLQNAGPMHSQVDAQGVQPHLVSCLINALVAEKSAQYQNRPSLRLSCEIDARAYIAFALVDAADFKRVLSNLIDNAVQSTDEAGLVTVSLTCTEPHLSIVVDDDGCGIPKERLPYLGKRGATFGKADGSWLGLYHATRNVAAWGGNLEIFSNTEVRPGTRIRITLPIGKQPPWFPSEIDASAVDTVVVADDDPSVHAIWSRRFVDSRVQAKTVHLKTPMDVRSWFDRHETSKGDCVLFLCDHEFKGHNCTGLSLIKEAGLAATSILVTSYFEDANLREQCLLLGAKLIPKVLAGFIPVRTESVGTSVAAHQTYSTTKGVQNGSPLESSN